MDKIICWWSGGITSAVACQLAIELYGLENCRFIFIDTQNEHSDTYRFKNDCEKWYGKEIETLSRIGKDYDTIQDVWIKFNSLNVAKGAICSSELKRKVRLDFEKENSFKYQVFGFDIDETIRAKSMTLNYPKAKAIYPLLLHGLSKRNCIDIIESAGLEIPIAYKLGFNNNNCLNTGCVQGGIGYWQKMKIDMPNKFKAMAEMEHKLTDLRGEPVTMLKDQSKESAGLVFLMPHPNYPNIKNIGEMKGRPSKPLMECSGICGTNDLKKSETEKEINYQEFNLFA